MAIQGRPFKAIAAMAENRVIGADGKIPWHIPDEFKWFKRTTVRNTLVMGRKTYESIGKPLPERMTLVLSREWTKIPGVVVVSDWDELEPDHYMGSTFLAGGGEIYRQGLRYCHEVYLTIVKKRVEGDAFFPELEPEFVCDEEPLLDHPEFTVWRYVAKS